MTATFAIYDPTPFTGGSKIALHRIVACAIASDSTAVNQRVLVLTVDANSWSDSQFLIRQLYLPTVLQSAANSKLYYLKQLLLCLQVCWYLLRFRHIKSLINISGPGVDLAGLIAAKLLRVRAIQLLQGPAAKSKASAYALTWAWQIFYLESARQDLERLLSMVKRKVRLATLCKSEAFSNGLLTSEWPTLSHSSAPAVFWAASLLQWKGLETLKAALASEAINPRIKAHVCYIEPQSTTLSCSPVPLKSRNLCPRQAPANLDELRAGCSIFVSTAKCEPFGLSILEAMAAGLCPVIPADGAYWDRLLVDGVSAMKYRPDDANALTEKLNTLAENMPLTKAIGARARRFAQAYKAELCYAPVVQSLMREKPAGNPQANIG